MATKPNEVPVDVTWEDQKRICTFSRLHKKIKHLQSKLQRLVEDSDKIDDACSEIMICDVVKYVFGEAFVDLPAEEAGELLEAEKERLGEERGTVETELATLNGALDALKAQLYAKFGTQIYLEDK